MSHKNENILHDIYFDTYKSCYYNLVNNESKRILLPKRYNYPFCVLVSFIQHT